MKTKYFFYSLTINIWILRVSIILIIRKGNLNAFSKDKLIYRPLNY